MSQEIKNSYSFNSGRLKLFIFAVVAAAHGLVIFFGSFRIETVINTPQPAAGVMRLVDLQERIPVQPPSLPPESAPETSQQESTVQETQAQIAEIMIVADESSGAETSFEPVQAETPFGTFAEIAYIPQHRLSVLPVLPEEQIRSAIIYPPMARRLNIEGIVFLELFIDSEGSIRDIHILRETPPGRGFAEAAVNALRGIQAISPAELNGVPVAARFRYSISFRLN